MTVSTIIAQFAYAGDNSTKSFPTTFQFWDSELEVFVRTELTGAEELLVIVTDYTITHPTNGGTGTVVIADARAAPTTLEELHIRRVSTTDQDNPLAESTVLPSAAIEESLDRAALRQQEDRLDFSGRALKLPVTDIPPDGDTPPDMEIPNTTARAVANAVLGFDAVTGNPTVVVGATLPSVTVTTDGATLVGSANFAAMRAVLDLEPGVDIVINRGGLADSLEIGTIGSRPVAGTFGQGFFIASDDLRLYYSDGSDWFEVGIAQFAGASLPAAASPAGKIYFDTDKLQFLRDNGTTLDHVRAPYPRGHIDGIDMTVSGTTDVSFAEGTVRGGTSTTRDFINGIHSGSAIVKELDTAGWAAGSAAGGRPSADGLAANKWHHCFMLIHPDTGAIDFGFDDELEAGQLLADAAVISAGYTQYRYVGSQKETSAGTGVIKPQLQHGDDFIWTTVPPLDIATTGADYSSQTNLVLAHCPPDIVTKANVVIALAGLSNSQAMGFGSGGVTLGVPALSATPLGQLGTDTGAPIFEDRRSEMNLFTDTSQQIVTRTGGDTGVDLDVQVLGYNNPRGKNF